MTRIYQLGFEVGRFILVGNVVSGKGNNKYREEEFK